MVSTHAEGSEPVDSEHGTENEQPIRSNPATTAKQGPDIGLAILGQMLVWCLRNSFTFRRGHNVVVMPRAPAAALAISDEDRRGLLQVVDLRSVPQSVALRVRIVLGASEGIGNKVLAPQMGTSLPTVWMWRWALSIRLPRLRAESRYLLRATGHSSAVSRSTHEATESQISLDSGRYSPCVRLAAGVHLGHGNIALWAISRFEGRARVRGVSRPYCVMSSILLFSSVQPAENPPGQLATVSYRHEEEG